MNAIMLQTYWMLSHRIALSRDKAGVLALANRGNRVRKPEDILRDPYVLEFAGIPVSERLKEGRHGETPGHRADEHVLELLQVLCSCDNCVRNAVMALEETMEG